MVSAKDNDNLIYTLITPVRHSISNRPKLDELSLYYSVPLNKEKVKELIVKVDEAIIEIAKEYPYYKGYSSRFHIEGKKTDLSFSVEVKEDIVFVTLTVFTGKTFIYVDKPELKYEKIFDFNLKTKKELQGFKDLLNQSLIEDNFGYVKDEKPKAIKKILNKGFGGI